MAAQRNDSNGGQHDRQRKVGDGKDGIEEAASDMELMDYDFQLFTDAVSGWDAVVHRRHDGYGVSYLPDQSRLTAEAAVDALDATDWPYLFYRDVGSGRGNVLYRRHDGNYGLITPAE